MGDLPIIAAFMLPLLLLGAIWIGRWGSLPARLFMTLLLPVFFIWHWYGVQAQKGWPVAQDLPEQFQLIAADVVEPHQSARRRAAIYMWLRSEDGGEPRAFALPYSRQLHKMLNEVRVKTQSGQAQVGVIRDDDGTGQGAQLDAGRRLSFEDAPRSNLPPKR